MRGEAFAASLVVRSQNFYGGTEKNDGKFWIVGDLADTAMAHLPDLESVTAALQSLCINKSTYYTSSGCYLFRPLAILAELTTSTKTDRYAHSNKQKRAQSAGALQSSET